MYSSKEIINRLADKISNISRQKTRIIKKVVPEEDSYLSILNEILIDTHALVEGSEKIENELQNCHSKRLELEESARIRKCLEGKKIAIVGGEKSHTDEIKKRITGFFSDSKNIKFKETYAGSSITEKQLSDKYGDFDVAIILTQYIGHSLSEPAIRACNKNNVRVIMWDVDFHEMILTSLCDLFYKKPNGRISK